MRQIRSGENMRAARMVRTSIKINNNQPEKIMITILRRDIVAVLALGLSGMLLSPASSARAQAPAVEKDAKPTVIVNITRGILKALRALGAALK